MILISLLRAFFVTALIVSWIEAVRAVQEIWSIALIVYLTSLVTFVIWELAENKLISYFNPDAS
jgi:hypothetical protein